MIRAYRLSSEGLNRLRQAMRLLRRHAPEEYARLVREIRSVEFRPGGCGSGAVACTGGDYDRRIVFNMDPARLGTMQLAVVLSHEARHHYTDRTGTHWLLAHRCRRCANPWERVRDPLYRQDELVLRRLWAGRQQEARRTRAARQVFGGLAIAASVGLATWAGAEAFRALVRARGTSLAT